MSVMTPLEQKLAALERANGVRFAGAALKRDVKTGALSLADALADERCGPVEVGDLLMALPHWGRKKSRGALKGLGISEHRRVRDLTVREVGAVSCLRLVGRIKVASDALQLKVAAHAMKGIDDWLALVEAALDAADEAVPVVSEAEFRAREEAIQQTGKAYDYWQAHYKDRAERAEAAARDMAKALMAIVDAVYRTDVSIRSGDLRTRVEFQPGDWSTVQAARDVLARWPSFSGEEGTER